MDTHYFYSISINKSPLTEEMSVLFSGEGRPVEGHYIGPAVHDFYLIHLVLDGEGTFETLGESYRLRKGDVFVIFPDILVKYEADMQRPWSYVWVAFSGGLADRALSELGITPDRTVIRSDRTTRLRRLFRMLRKSLDRHSLPSLGNAESAGWLRLLLYELGKEIQRRQSENGEECSTNGDGEDADVLHQPSYSRIDQAVRLMNLQYAHPLTIEGIAATLGYHRSHLTKLFKLATGLSPAQYLFKVRMKKAERLLESDLTIAQVASSVGFGDPLFFSKQFRRWSGRSPTAFRKERQRLTE